MQHTTEIRIEKKFQFDDCSQTGITLAEIDNSECQIDGYASGKIKHSSSEPEAEQ